MDPTGSPLGVSSEPYSASRNFPDCRVTSTTKTALLRHPQYAVETVRLSSYTRWPDTSTQNPVNLSEAGFFYAGHSDCVRCFTCGGGLRNWQDGDIPWIEHARWYPNCDYVKQHKGNLFIQMHHHDQNQLTQTANSSEEKIDKRSEEKHVARPPTGNDVAVRRVKEMGYSAAKIEAAVEQLRKQGHRNHSATDILDIIFSQEENQITTNTTTEHSTPATYTSYSHQTINSGVLNGSTDSHSLFRENQILKEQMICKICLDNDACVVYLPCGHMVTCQDCAPTISKCCICRTLIQGTVKAYL